MPEPTYMDELSPLDQIRLVEAEVTRKIVAARDAAEHGAINARAQSAAIKKHAEEQGIRAGQIRYKETVAKAEEEAKVIVAQAQCEADDLLHGGKSRMEQVVAESLKITLGVQGDQS